MEITYTWQGDYLIPDIILNEPPKEFTEPITKYGAMRRAYLREHRSITYNRLLLTDNILENNQRNNLIRPQRVKTSLLHSHYNISPPCKQEYHPLKNNSRTKTP